MSVRPWAVFHLVGSAGGASKGGLGANSELGEAIRGIFIRCGAEVFVADAQEDRWTFDLRYKEQLFVCRLVSVPAMLVLRLDSFPDGRVSLKKPVTYAQLAEAFARELAQDPRFRDILWYPRRTGGPPVEPDGSGSRSPLAYAPRPTPPLIWKLQIFAFLIGCLGVLDAAGKFIVGEFVAGLSPLIGSAVLLLLGGGAVEPTWQGWVVTRARATDEDVGNHRGSRGSDTAS